MNKILYWIKNNKLLAAVVFVGVFVVVFDLFVSAYDIVQFVRLSKNSADFMRSFKSLNIFAGVLNMLEVGFIVFYVIFRKRKIKIQLSGNSK